MTPADKGTLRVQARCVRRRLAETLPDAAERAASHVGALSPGQIVAVYRAMGSELDPEPLARALIDQGRVLCLPVVLARDAPMIFRRWSPGDPLEVDVAGCPAPLLLAEMVTPDLVITPLLAFDAEGGRLGQGGGYYDRTFAASAEAIRIGLAYSGQLLAGLPIEPHDARLHGILTETGLHRCIWR